MMIACTVAPPKMTDNATPRCKPEATANTPANDKRTNRPKVLSESAAFNSICTIEVTYFLWLLCTGRQVDQRKQTHPYRLDEVPIETYVSQLALQPFCGSIRRHHQSQSDHCDDSGQQMNHVYAGHEVIEAPEKVDARSKAPANIACVFESLDGQEEDSKECSGLETMPGAS